MDNFSQDNLKNENGDQQTHDAPIIEDIQFEDLIDVDELQNQLKKKIEQGDSGIEEDEEPSISVQVPSPIAAAPLPIKKSANDAKKYVVYVDSDNIDYMENLSADDRRQIINKVLKEQHQLTQKNKELEAKRQFLINVILAIITFIIAVPVMFYIVNKSTEATVENYNEAKQNFTKIYRPQGKIKQNSFE